jgi:hypothetical protein
MQESVFLPSKYVFQYKNLIIKTYYRFEQPFSEGDGSLYKDLCTYCEMLNSPSPISVDGYILLISEC